MYLCLGCNVSLSVIIRLRVTITVKSKVTVRLRVIAIVTFQHYKAAAPTGSERHFLWGYQDLV